MKIVIIGAGSTAVTVADILAQDRNFRIAGFVGTEEEQGELGGERLYGDIPFLGSRLMLDKIKADGVLGFIVAIGNNYTREERYYEATQTGLMPINAISHNAVIEPSVRIGKNVIITSGCIVSHGVTIGNNTCLDPGVIVLINSVIGENCYLQSGCIVGGLCEIGRNVTIGTRSTISPQVVIGKNNNIMTGDVVDENLEDLARAEG